MVRLGYVSKYNCSVIMPNFTIKHLNWVSYFLTTMLFYTFYIVILSVAVASNCERVIYFSKKFNSAQHKVKHKEVFKLIKNINSQKTFSTLIKAFL